MFNKKDNRKISKKQEIQNIESGFRNVIKDKLQMLAILGLALSLFLSDVNANAIGSYGTKIQVHVLQGITVFSTSMFWLGFFITCISFLILATRAMFDERYKAKFDLFFIILGTLGLMIILSGGLLIFWHTDNLAIPFFTFSPTRITYYHIGIALELISLVYFGLTKK